MVKRVLLFALLATFIFAACNDEMEIMENGNLESGDVSGSILSQDSIPSDTIVPRDTVIVLPDTIVPPIEDPKYWIDSIVPLPVDPQPIEDPEYPTDSVPGPIYPSPIVEPEYPVDTVSPIHEPWIPPVDPDSIVRPERINTFK